MNIQSLKVPPQIQYLSEWGELDDLLPQGQHFILDKRLTGCGATEKYLRDAYPAIIAMPRKHLLFNKLSQHTSDNVFLYRFIDKKQYFSDKTPSENQLKEFDCLLVDYLRRGSRKILTTYDSLPKVHDILKLTGMDVDDFKVIVDESQQIFGDAPIKANVEHQFYLALKKFRTVIYLSATPFLSEYLDMSDQFKELPIIRLQWEEGRTTKNQINVKKLTGSITQTCSEIISRFKSGDTPAIKVGDETICSREAVFFLNDVGAIIDIIKNTGLTPGEVNILCAPRRENIQRLEKLSTDKKEKFVIGTIPAKGEANKMFTFCTSTVYIGSDFYSDNAYTYIFANPNVQSLCLDVSTDIQQILGRQRLDSNPFRGIADLYYHLKKPLTTQKENEEMIERKRQETRRQIENFKSAVHPDSMLKTMEAYIRKSDHKDQYCCISEDEKGNKTIVENSLIWIAERRAWDIANKVYSGDFSLFEALRLTSDVAREIDTDDDEIREFFDLWNQDGQFKRRAKLYCDTIEKSPGLLEKCSFIPGHFHEYYEALGRNGMEDLQWRADYIKSALAPTPPDELPHEKIAEMVMAELLVGQEYTKEFVKNVLKKIYTLLSIKGKPSATDCSRYITIEEFSSRKGGKKTAMIRILSHHREQIALFDRITDVNHPRTYNIHYILDLIKNGNYLGTQQRVAAIRRAKNKNEVDALKLSLPAIIWNGVFDYKHKSGCRAYSSFTALDFDHIIPEEMDSIKARLQAESCVYACFVTPSGNGLKAIILHDNYFPSSHGDLYDQLLQKFDIAHPDSSTRDLARGNYMSYDTDLWINPEPVPFHYIPNPDFEESETMPTRTIIRPDNGKITSVEDGSWISRFLSELNRVCKTDESIINILRKEWTGASISERGRNVTVFSYAGILCKAGVEEGKAVTFIAELIPSLPKTELYRTVKQAYSLNIFGCDRHKYRKRR